MTIQLTVPLGNKQNVKDIIFSILTKEYPLRTIELTNYIRKRYGKSVTFQAVRKSLLQLKEEGIIRQEENKYLIDKEWVNKTRKVLEDISKNLNLQKKKPTGIESIEGNLSVFTFNSLNEAMLFWQEIIDEWYLNLKKNKGKINCYQAAHAWEALLHPDKESNLMGKLKEKGIKSFILISGNSTLDKNIKKFYKNLGIKVTIDASKTEFDKGYYVGTYGETIVQTHYPKKLVRDLEKFFKKSRSLKRLDLGELSKIVNQKIAIKLTIIKDQNLAKQINKSIITKIKEE